MRAAVMSSLIGAMTMVAAVAQAEPTTRQEVKVPFAFTVNGQEMPAGTYSGNGANAITVDNVGGRNGAFGPGYIQLDARIGWRLKAGPGRTVDLNADIINVTNRANFVNPTADRRSTNFLLLTTLYGGGQPRQAQVGVRLGF